MNQENNNPNEILNNNEGPVMIQSDVVDSNSVKEPTLEPIMQEVPVTQQEEVKPVEVTPPVVEVPTQEEVKPVEIQPTVVEVPQSDIKPVEVAPPVVEIPKTSEVATAPVSPQVPNADIPVQGVTNNNITLDNMPTPRDSIGIPNTNNPLNMQAPKGGVPTVQDAKKVQSEYKPPSKFKTFLLIIFFIGLIAFIMFLPEIKDYLEEFQNRGKTEENVKITTGKLKCNKKTNTKTLDKDYDLVFHFKDNKLEKTEFSITTRGDATSDEEELNGLASTCKQLEKEAESLNGLYVKCTLTTGKLEEIQSFDLSILDTEKLDAAFSEAGGNNPEYQYQQDMDKIEQSMNASGYTCVRER